MKIIPEWPAFFTATCLNWIYILEHEHCKQIIISSLKYLVDTDRISLYAYVIMNNHIHLIWQMKPGFKPHVIQHSFMKYTAQMIKYFLQSEDPGLLKKLLVNARDRKYQVWERNPLTVELFTSKVYHQKMTYIHNNPVKASLCMFPGDYRYSSARYYESGYDEVGLFCI